MAYLSIRDRRALKSRKRLMRPVLGIAVGLLATAALIYLAIVKPATPSAPPPLVQSATPGPESLKAEEISRFQAEFKAAVGENDDPKLEAASLALLRVDPQSGKAWRVLGQLQSHQGDLPAALVSFSKALEFSEEKSPILAARASLHRKLGDLPSALLDLEEATRLEPGNAGVANRLLIFKIQAGRAEEVRAFVATYEKAAITSQAPFWLLGAAALSMQDGDPGKAAAYLSSLKALLSPEQFSRLLDDPFFEPYHQESSLQAYFLQAPDIAP